MVLKIYKASAGSGKTYRLTEEYLKLVIENPDKYRKVLAITFTNKATEEMKSRILSELHKLSIGSKSNHKEALLETHKWLSEEKLQRRAKEVLQNILYNYNHFDISTIDSFFQKIIKNFSKELGIKLGYNIELDNSAVLSKAIDLMLQEVGKNNALTNWLVSFTQERIEDGKSWQIKYHIEQFGKELFKEKYQQFNTQVREKLEDKDFLKNFLSEINKLIGSFENFQAKLGKEALEVIKQNGLSIDDFSYRSGGVVGHFIKTSEKSEFEPKSRALAAIDNPSKWYSKSQDNEIKSRIEQLVESNLNQMLKTLVNHYKSEFNNYNSALSVKRYFNVLGILTDLSSKISEIREEESILLISDVNQLLNSIIDENDTPFIYEKTGSRYDHFLIDEFQDTSDYQWSNLKPLVSNSLDGNNFNLVVGDVKQSIYRWRNGDWNLLNQKIHDDIHKDLIDANSLVENYRSEENIIKFNNSVFKAASILLKDVFNTEQQELIKQVYSDVVQSLPSNKEKGNGFVRFKFFEGAYSSWKDEIVEVLPKQIDELLANGFNQKDICILVRNSKDGNEIAKILFNHDKYNVISKDSLFLKNSTSVRIIVGALKQILHPSDQINLKNLVSEYKNIKQFKKDNDSISPQSHQGTKQTQKEDYQVHSFRESLESLSLSGNQNYLTNQTAFLNSDDLSQLPNKLNKLLIQSFHFGLQELVEQIIDIFELSKFKEEHSYILAFQDALLEFQKGNPSDLGLFLDWWNEKGKEKAIQIPGNTNAIQIMTIHKSKGLDFEVVLIPYFNWNLDHNSIHDNVLWCNSDVIPFDQLDLLPVCYSSKLENSVFNNNYQEEKLNTYIDNFNLMYVAFTRARQGLVVFGSKPAKDKISNISELVYSSFSLQNEELNLSEYFNTETFEFNFGDIKNTGRKDTESVINTHLKEFFTNRKTINLRIKYDAENLFDTHKKSQLNYGKFMHEVLSNIYTLNDIDSQIEKLYIEGKVNREEKKELVKKLHLFLEQEPVRGWFNEDWEIKNETPILKPGNEIDIPDRIMIKEKEAIVIDFKFGKEYDKYIDQVESYKADLKEMGYETKGYLVYFENNKLIEVQSATKTQKH